ncbi:MAG: hypothetical protein KIS67_03420 [Verrucomicrobiae bacterium]|nr:hypothetical protein [Verrucomicrobiae bacterium]
MSAAEVIEQIEKLPREQQQEVFVLLAKKVVGGQAAESKPWLGKKLSFDEACAIVFRDNRELLGLLAK